jgi:hypothetical protein
VRGYGDLDVESFEDYYARWPEELATIPRSIVEDWIHRHWVDFRNHWMQLNPHRWDYTLESFSNADILSIGHIGGWIPELDAEGVEYVSGKPRSKANFARYMLSVGTFPVPILVAQRAGQIIHPRGNGEFMKEPYQLIEGHCRLACMRGMIKSEYPILKASHNVWVANIPADAIRSR